jgi:hypothetical protein
MAKRRAAKRQLITTRTDKRYTRRGKRGEFRESDDVGRSAAADRSRRARTRSTKGQGDRGDRNR